MHTLKKIYSVLEYRYFFLILFVFSLLRLPSLFEPNWYGDEGIYQVVGRAVNQGRILYSQIWDNKPPLLYLTYAFVNADQFGIRLLSYIAGLLAVALFYFLAKHILRSYKARFASTSLFAFLFAIPLTEANIANAENFMLVFLIFSGLLVYKEATENQRKHAHHRLFIAGILLSVAFLYKIVAVFDFAAFFLFLLFVYLPKNVPLQQSLSRDIQKLFPFLLGFFLPIALTAFYFLYHGAFSAFLSATLSNNVSYVGSRNYFLIPQGLLITKLAVLGLAVFFLFRKRSSFTPGLLFILLWFSFSLFNAFFSQRPYTHYVLVVLASFSLLIGATLEYTRYRLGLILLSLISIITVVHVFSPSARPKLSLFYYQNFLALITKEKSLVAYQAFFDPDTPRDYDIAMFLRNHMRDTEGTMFLWGDSAQIYTLSHTLPPGRYTVAYHITSEKAVAETQLAIDQKKPQFLVLLPESPLPQLLLTSYVYKATIGNATIYERTF